MGKVPPAPPIPEPTHEERVQRAREYLAKHLKFKHYQPKEEPCHDSDEITSQPKRQRAATTTSQLPRRTPSGLSGRSVKKR